MTAAQPPQPTEAPPVRVGQVWADNDSRIANRQVKVIAVDATHATVRAYPSERGRRTRIRLNRFRPTSTGYRLVTDAPRQDPAC